LKSYEGGRRSTRINYHNDGEDHQGDALEAAKEAKNEGVVDLLYRHRDKRSELIPIEGDGGQGHF